MLQIYVRRTLRTAFACVCPLETTLTDPLSCKNTSSLKCTHFTPVLVVIGFVPFSLQQFVVARQYWLICSMHIRFRDQYTVDKYYNAPVLEIWIYRLKLINQSWRNYLITCILNFIQTERTTWHLNPFKTNAPRTFYYQAWKSPMCTVYFTWIIAY